MAEINDLNVTDASNTARFPESMAPSNVNNSARALEGILARWHKDINGSLVAGGTADALTLSANQTISAYYDGLNLGFEVALANTGAATLNVDSVGAKSIVKDGNSTALAAGDLVAGRKVWVVFDSASDVWQMVTATPLAIGTDVQAQNDYLQDIADLGAPANSAMLVGDGTDYVLESGATLRASLGLTPGTDIPSLTGGGASGSWAINITGNAATATSATSATSASSASSVPYSGITSNPHDFAWESVYSGSRAYSGGAGGQQTYEWRINGVVREMVSPEEFSVRTAIASAWDGSGEGGWTISKRVFTNGGGSTTTLQVTVDFDGTYYPNSSGINFNIYTNSDNVVTSLTAV